MVKKKTTKKKEKGERSTVRKKQSIQKHSSSKYFTLKPKFHRDIPLTNHDLIK